MDHLLSDSSRLECTQVPPGLLGHLWPCVPCSFIPLPPDNMHPNYSRPVTCRLDLVKQPARTKPPWPVISMRCDNFTAGKCISDCKISCSTCGSFALLLRISKTCELSPCPPVRRRNSVTLFLKWEATVSSRKRHSDLPGTTVAGEEGRVQP